MKSNTRRLLSLIALCNFGTISHGAWADATIKMECLTPPEEIRVNRIIFLRVSVDSNDTTPIESVRFKVAYNTGSVNLIYNPSNDSQQDLGAVGATAAVAGAAANDFYREFHTQTPSAYAVNTPRCFLMRLQLRNGAIPSPFSVTLSDGVNGIAVRGADGSSLPHTFINNGVLELIPARVIATEWLSQTPVVPGQPFSVKVSLQSNDSEQASRPSKAQFRVFYETASVQWDGPPADGLLGAFLAGPETPAETTGTVYRDLTSAGYYVPTSKQAEYSSCTLRIPTGHGLVKGSRITVALDPPDLRFDGTYTVLSLLSTDGVVYLKSGAKIAKKSTGGTITPSPAIAPSSLPAFCTLKMRAAAADPTPPFRIWLEDIPGVAALEYLGAPLAHVYYSLPTRFTPIVSTELANPPSQIRVGESFKLRVRISNNDSGQIPVACFFRLKYNGSFLAMADITLDSLEELGPVRGSSTMGSPPNNYYDIYTDGYEPEFRPLFTNPNPVCFSVKFTLTAPPPGPLDITLADTTDWPVVGVGLMEKYQSTPIAHVLDSRNTLGIATARVVIPEIPAGDAIAPGTAFRVRVRVASNDQLSPPGACAFRVIYPVNAVALLSAAEGELGPVRLGPPEAAGEAGAGLVRQDITAEGNPLNTNVLAHCFDLTFQTSDPPHTPFSIAFEDQTVTRTLALAPQPEVNLDHLFDNSKIQNIVLTPVVSTLLHNPIVNGQNFTVQVKVTNNETASIPVSCSLGIRYSAGGAATWVGATPAELGQVFSIIPKPGPEGWMLGHVAVAGNTNSSIILPRCFNMTFKARPLAGRPFSILLEDWPTGASLVEKGTLVNMPHIFDNSATLNLAPAPALIVTELDPGYNLIINNREFRVRVRVSRNDYASIPAAARLRLSFDGTLVTFLGGLDGDLGPATSIQGGYGAAAAWADLTAAGNPANTNLTPLCFTARFRVNINPTGPVSIIASDAPTAATPLPVVEDADMNLPHEFQCAATQGMTAEILPTETPDPNATPTPKPYSNWIILGK